MKPIAVLLLFLFSPALHAQAPAFTSSDVADAVEQLTGRRAHMGAAMHLLSGERLVGPAITMQVVPDEGASAMGEGLKAIQVLESAPAGSVIVLALEGDKSFAVFGATFATLAKSRQLAGFVIDASMRGLSDFKRLELPLFAVGTVPGSAGGHFRLKAINEPVACAGVVVSPGDLIVGDADGVAVAPREQQEEVLARAKSLREEKEALLPLVFQHQSYTKAVQELKAIQNRD